MDLEIKQVVKEPQLRPNVLAAKLTALLNAKRLAMTVQNTLTYQTLSAGHSKAEVVQCA
jgi:hypothetical protein